MVIERVWNANSFAGGLHAVVMLLCLENPNSFLCFVRTDAFKYAITIMEGLVIKIASCFRGFLKCSVKKYNCVIAIVHHTTGVNVYSRQSGLSKERIYRDQISVDLRSSMFDWLISDGKRLATKSAMRSPMVDVK